MKSGQSREIWFGPPDLGEPKWVDDNTLVVGEQTLDARSDRFDWYESEPLGGYDTPEAAARAFLEGVASRSSAQARQASGPIVTDEDLAALRKRLFKTESAIEIGDVKLVRDPGVTASDQREYDITVDFLVDGARRTVRLQELVTQESGKWRAEWLELEGTY